MITVLFFLGFVVLVVGGELLVRGASRLASNLGLSALAIGLTVVAVGTSAPELAVSVDSALKGKTDIALGNVVGSNILNVLVILGLASAIAPLTISLRLIRLDVPVMIGVSVLLWILSMDGCISRAEGILLLVGFFVYLAFTILQSRNNRHSNDSGTPEQQPSAGYSPWSSAGFILVGLMLLGLGSRFVVDGAIHFARMLNVSELVIGLTVIAMGTSLPEAAASVVASIRGERDIAAGNIVGSNIANILLILGLSAALVPEGLLVSPLALQSDLPIMVATAVSCLPIFFTGHRIDRWEGILFVAYGLSYTAYLILHARQHDALPVFNAAMWWIVFPLSSVTILVFVVRQFRGHSDKAPFEKLAS